MDRILTCGICNASVPEAKAVVIKLTTAEIRLYKKQGVDLTECVYCKPCHKTLSDPVTGPSLGKGLYQARLREVFGVSDATAERAASGFKDKLLEKIKDLPKERSGAQSDRE